jgi:sulfoxide reductase heme-binding subunit YedZ
MPEVNTPSSLTDPTQHLFWLTSRALGIVAMLLVSASVGLGLAMSARLGARPGSTARLKTLHEAIALTALVAIAGHGLALLGDSYLRPAFLQIVVPFTLGHRTAWTGIGVIAGWLAVVLGLSFYVRRWIGPRLWRRMHRWTVLVYALALVHTLGAGTDARSKWLVGLLALAAVPVAVVGGYRLVSPGRRAKPAPVPGAAAGANRALPLA